jgi:hypothetical protein
MIIDTAVNKLSLFLCRSIISVLVEYDANMLLTDREGKTVYDYAHGNKKVTRSAINQ